MAIQMRSPFKSYDQLKKSGMTEEQARSIVEAIEEPVNFSFKELVTKSDLKAEIADVRTEIADVRTEIAEVRTEIAEVKGIVIRVEAELKAEINGIKSSLGRLHNLFISGFLVIIVGMVLSYFHH